VRFYALEVGRGVGSLLLRGATGVRLFMARDYSRAVQQLAPALVLGADVLPAHPWLGLTYLKLGRVDEAVRLLEGASERAVNRPSVMAALAMACAEAGRDADARTVMRTPEEQAREEYFPRSWLARAYAASGDKERALTWLERAYEERDGWLTLAKVDPTFDALREEPRFRAVLTKMGLP